MRMTQIVGENFNFGFNEDGAALYLAQLLRKVRRDNPAVDNPRKLQQWLRGDTTIGGTSVTAITPAQRNRILVDFLCACMMWHPSTNPIDRQGKGINEAAVEDTDPL